MYGKPRCKKPGFRNGGIMQKKCEVCKKEKPSNQFSEKDTKQVCVECKNKAIERAKKYFTKW
jgi:hypothetical protein